MPSSAAISVVILTYNSAASVGRTIRSLQSLSDDIHVVDSFSNDDTVAICRSLGCQVQQRAFRHYADQRNWTIDSLSLRHGWQFHVDADEELTPELADAIASLDLAHTRVDGYIIGRKIVFLGQELRHGATSRTWHYRLFKTGHGRCEDRLYDQHFVNFGEVGRINAFMLDHQENSLSEWTQRHNRWSDLEVSEALGIGPDRLGAQVQPNARGTTIERKRNVKARYYQAPLFLRSLTYFLYSYVLRLGFLDGARGYIYATLQAFWFRTLVDAKIYEAGINRQKI